jgi:hypothetical protein
MTEVDTDSSDGPDAAATSAPGPETGTPETGSPDTSASMPAPAHDAESGEAQALTAEAGAAPRAWGLRWWRELLYIVLVYLAYSAVRNQFGSGAGSQVDPDPAFNHAKAIIHIEQAIGLYFERALHQWYLDLPLDGIIRFWNVYYGVFHFVVAAGALVWLFRAAPARYRLWRNTLALMTLLALVGFASFSLMPPRLLDDPGIYGGCQIYAGADAARADEAGDPPCDEYEYIDTVAVYGGWASFGSEEMEAVSNQYAAMPSMHIGWSTWCAFVLVPLVKRRWLKVLVGAYPLFTLFDIIVTANHYWIDGLGGLVCLGAGFLISRAGTRWWEARRGLTGPDPATAPVPTPA